MEKREQIIKALRCCINSHHESCCQLGKWSEEWNCMTDLMKKSLILIEGLEAELDYWKARAFEGCMEKGRMAEEIKRITKERR